MSYWNDILQSRLSRRRVLAGTAGVGAGVLALSLSGCSGDDEGAKTKDRSGLLTQVEDSTKKAQVGGIWPHYETEKLTGISPLGAAQNSGLGAYVYSRLLRNKAFISPEAIEAGVEPDLATSWEVSNDRVVFKLRPNVKFDSRPPTSGRNLDIEDVKWSWNLWSSISPSRGEILNSVSPNSPITGMETPDAQTVVFKMAFPMAAVELRFAYQRYLYVLPVDAESKFDAKVDARGSGPFTLTKNTPSVGYEFRRNPSWHISGLPYLEGINTTFINDYAQRVAQLKAGNLWASDVRQEDVISVKREQPKLAMYAQPFPPSRPDNIGFSQLPGSPFLDVRVRRAMSMMVDREAWIDVFYNVAAFRKEGLPVESRWHSHFGAGEAPFWHNPQGKELGEGAQYFQLNVAEAVKMIKAAGHEKITAPMQFEAPVGERFAQVFAGMFNDSGVFNISLTPLTSADHTRIIHTGKGQFEGLGSRFAPGAGGDIDQYLSTRFNVPAADFNMFKEPIPKIQPLVEAQRKELDAKKRLDILFQLEKEMALQMPTLPHAGIANGFDIAWPHLANFNAFSTNSPGANIAGQTAAADVWIHYWYDKSKQV